MVVVAQLVRALDCGSRGRRFETGLPPYKKGLHCNPFFVVDGKLFLERKTETNVSNIHAVFRNSR